MEPAPRARDPEREKDKAVADKAVEPAPDKAGGRVKAPEGDRARAGVKAREGRAKAKAVDGGKAVSRSFGMIYGPCSDPSHGKKI